MGLDWQYDTNPDNNEMLLLMLWLISMSVCQNMSVISCTLGFHSIFGTPFLLKQNETSEMHQLCLDFKIQVMPHMFLQPERAKN